MRERERERSSIKEIDEKVRGRNVLRWPRARCHHYAGLTASPTMNREAHGCFGGTAYMVSLYPWE